MPGHLNIPIARCPKAAAMGLYFALLSLVAAAAPAARAGSETLYTTHTADFSGSPTAAPPGYVGDGMVENLIVGAFDANNTVAGLETPCIRMAADIPSPVGTFSGWSYLDLRLQNTTRVLAIKVDVFNCNGDFITAIQAPAPTACAQGTTAPHCPATTTGTTCSTLDLTQLNILVPPTTPGADGIRLRLSFTQSDLDPATPLRWLGHTVAATRNDWVSLAWTTPSAPRTIAIPTDRVHPFAFTMSHSGEPLHEPFIDVDVALAERDTRYCNDCFRTYRGINYSTVRLRRLNGSETGGGVWRQNPTINPTSLGYSWNLASLLVNGRLNPGTFSAGFSLQLEGSGNAYAAFLEGRGYALPIKLTHGRRACGNLALRNAMTSEHVSPTTTRAPVEAGPNHELRFRTGTEIATTHIDGQTGAFRILGEGTTFDGDISPVEDMTVTVFFDDPNGCVASATISTTALSGIGSLGNAIDIETFTAPSPAPHLQTYVARAQGQGGSFLFYVDATPTGACTAANGLEYAIVTKTTSTTDVNTYTVERRWPIRFKNAPNGVCRAWANASRPDRWHTVYGSHPPDYFFSRLGTTPALAGVFGLPGRPNGGYIRPGDWFGLNAAFDNRTHTSFDIVHNTWSYIRFSSAFARFHGVAAIRTRAAGRRIFSTCDPNAPMPDSPLFFDLDPSEIDDPLAAPPGWFPVLNDQGDVPSEPVDPFDVHGNPCFVLAAFPDDIATDSLIENAYFQVCDGDSTSTCPAPPLHTAMAPTASAVFFGVNEELRRQCPVAMANRSLVVADGSMPASHLARGFEPSHRVPTPTNPATWDFGPLNGGAASMPVEGAVHVLDFHQACPWLAPAGPITVSLRDPGVAPVLGCTNAMLNAAVQRVPDCAACLLDPRPDNPDCQAQLVFDGPCATPPASAAASNNTVRTPLFVVRAPIGPAAFKGLPINVCASPRRLSSAPGHAIIGADNDIVKNHGVALGVSTQPSPMCFAPIVDGVAAFATNTEAPTNAGRAQPFLIVSRGTVQPGALAVPNLYAGIALPRTSLCSTNGATTGEFDADIAYIKGHPDAWMIEASSATDCSSNIAAPWHELTSLTQTGPSDAEATAAGFTYRADIPSESVCVRARARFLPNTLLAGGQSLEIAVRTAFRNDVPFGRQICATTFAGAETTNDLGPTLTRSTRGTVTTLVRVPGCGDGFLDAGEVCDDGAGTGLGCGGCAWDCSGISLVEPGFEATSKGHEENIFTAGTWVGRGDVPVSQGGAATGNLWQITWSQSDHQTASLSPPNVAVRTTKPSTPGNSQNLIARVGMTTGGTTVDADTLCGLRVRWYVNLVDHLTSGSIGAGLRTTLLQGNFERWIDSPRNAANGDYVEVFISPAVPEARGDWFFSKAELLARNLDLSAPIHAGLLIARLTVSANDTTFHVDDLRVDVLHDLDQDGICDGVDTAVCGNGLVESGEACDPGCGGGADVCGCNADCTWRDTTTTCIDDGVFCNGPERCDGNGSCVPQGDPCGEPGYCSEDLGLCRDCLADADCEGELRCEPVSGACIECFSDADCDDRNRCTSDSCNSDGFCSNTLTPVPSDDATCDNVDDDCDGLTDEDYESIDTACGTGICAVTGIIRCIGGAEMDTCVADAPGVVQERFEAGFGTWAAGTYRSGSQIWSTTPGFQMGRALTGGVDDSAWVWGIANPLGVYAETVRHYATYEGSPRRRRMLGGRIEGAFKVHDGEVRADSGTRNTARARWYLAIQTTATPPAYEYWVARDELAWNPNDDVDWTVRGIDIVYENFAFWAPFTTVGYVAPRERFENGVANVVSFGIWHTDAAIIVNSHRHASWSNNRNYAVIATGTNVVRLGVDNIRYLTPTTDDGTCNGVDEDCDGVVDNDFGIGDVCTVGVGACAREGIRVCANETTSTCPVEAGEPATETCNGIDDDCDGDIDNGFDIGQACREGVGACAVAGILRCDGNGGTECSAVPLAPVAEACNGLDDDCNGLVDDIAEATIECPGECGGVVVTSCVDGVGVGSCADFYASRAGAACGLGDACLGAGTCRTDGSCGGRIATVCKDENPCTSDICDPSSGCVHLPVSGVPCNDDDLCTTNDICVEGLCVADPVVCPTPADRCPGVGTCDSAAGTCMHSGLPRVRDSDCDGVAVERDCDDDEAALGSRLFDADCDGVSTLLDCDDTDPEAGSRLNDADCDGVPAANDCDDTNPRAASVDNDGDCDGVATGLDCDDGDATITSICTDCVDDDNDGRWAPTPGCPIGDDCDDDDAESTHRPDDGDCDGVVTDLDCNDSDPGLGARDLDADCDGSPSDIDCDDNDPTIAGPCASPCYDRDLDGHFARSAACVEGTDCNDADTTSLTTLEDRDCDTVPDLDDNCRDVPNPNQRDRDNDGVGDVCDVCPTVADPEQLATNGSGLGDACLDSDGDGIPNVQDNCPNVPNTDQADGDNDGRGDACSVRVQRERREEGCGSGSGAVWWLGGLMLVWRRRRVFRNER